jgi:hypothetical protein
MNISLIKANHYYQLILQLHFHLALADSGYLFFAFFLNTMLFVELKLNVSLPKMFDAVKISICQ